MGGAIPLAPTNLTSSSSYGSERTRPRPTVRSAVLACEIGGSSRTPGVDKATGIVRAQCAAQPEPGDEQGFLALDWLERNGYVLTPIPPVPTADDASS